MNAGFLWVAKLNSHHNRVQRQAGRREGGRGRVLAGRRERGLRGNYSKKLLTLGAESFVTLP